MDDATRSRLAKVHPALRDKVTRLITALATKGYDVRVVQGLRTFAEQDALYAQGRTKPGQKVTNARGGQSNHNYGLAVDLCPFKGGQPDWNDSTAFTEIGKAAKAVQLEWGGTWKSIKDMPHVQIPGLTVSECQTLYKLGGLDAVWAKASKVNGYDSPAPAVDNKPILKKGSQGSMVVLMQQRLIKYSFLAPNSADGKFGPKTEEGVKGFQAWNGLEETGIVDKATWTKLLA